jgi:hypothetical protein
MLRLPRTILFLTTHNLLPMENKEEISPEEYEKLVKPHFDSLFSGKYDLIIKPHEEDTEHSDINLSLIIRMLCTSVSRLAQQQIASEALQNTK